MYLTLCELCVPAPGSVVLRAHHSVWRGTGLPQPAALRPVRSVTERLQLLFQGPSPSAGLFTGPSFLWINADLGFVKPLICAAARCGRVGLTDTPPCRAPLLAFLPLSLALTE